MPDMLVKLYDLPAVHPLIDALRAQGVAIRAALSHEKPHVLDWVRTTFNEGWAGECDVAFSRQPVACLIAIEDGAVVGFACHESTCRGFFGPTGVAESHRGRGIGKALFLASLHAMAALGYAYAVIGSAGPVDFYARTAGAIPIEDSTPGIYRTPLRRLPGIRGEGRTVSGHPTP